MPALRNSYPCIRRGDDVSWGGSQAWASREELRRWGCGVVAAADLLLYLRLFLFLFRLWRSLLFRDSSFSSILLYLPFLCPA